MDKQLLFQRYRKYMTRAMIMTVSVVSILEILVYFIFVRIGNCTLSFADEYLFDGVLVPIGANLLVLLATLFVNHSPRISEEKKNDLIINGITAVACIITLCHREYLITTCTCLFPMILSTAFNDKKLVLHTFLFSLITGTITVILSILDRTMDLDKEISYIIMYGFIIVGYVACLLSMRYSQLSFQIIERDFKTGLYNFRSFTEKMHEAMEITREEGTKLCLAIIDIDHFKQVNDNYTHLKGDVVLRKLAEILEQHCQPQDKAFRYGGEEFAVIFVGKTLEEARQQLQKMHTAFSETKFAFTDEKITFSAGIVSYCNDKSSSDFEHRADLLLYEAKRSGRNRIVADLQVEV